MKFLRLRQNEYDLIINDAIDPLGHNAGLFTKEFYGNCYRALKEDGIMVYQHGSPFYDEDEESCRVMHRKASHSFSNQQGISGTHSDLFFGILAFWICIKEISSTGTSGC